MGKTWSVADTLNSSAHNKGTFLHSACGAFPFVFYLQLCPPLTQGPGECFPKPPLQYFFFPSVIPMALYLQTPTALLWQFSRETAACHSFPLFSQPFLVALSLHLGKQYVHSGSLMAEQCAAPVALERTHREGSVWDFLKAIFSSWPLLQFALSVSSPLFFFVFFHFSPEITFTITIRICHQLQTSANKSPCT